MKKSKKELLESNGGAEVLLLREYVKKNEVVSTQEIMSKFGWTETHARMRIQQVRDLLIDDENTVLCNAWGIGYYEPRYEFDKVRELLKSQSRSLDNARSGQRISTTINPKKMRSKTETAALAIALSLQNHMEAQLKTRDQLRELLADPELNNLDDLIRNETASPWKKEEPWSKTTEPAALTVHRVKHICGNCGKEGHNRRTCKA